MFCTLGFRDPGGEQWPRNNERNGVQAEGPWGWAFCPMVQKVFVSLLLAGAASIAPGPVECRECSPSLLPQLL